MKTKFDINEDVFIVGRVKKIAIDEKGEIMYKVEIKNDSDYKNTIIFYENEIIGKEQKK